jgi:hypothetical protein
MLNAINIIKNEAHKSKDWKVWQIKPLFIKFTWKMKIKLHLHFPSKKIDCHNLQF